MDFCSLKQVADRNKFYDLNILHINLSNQNQKLLSGIFKDCTNFSIRFFNFSAFFEANKNILHNANQAKCLKFLIFDVFSLYNRIIYFDSDMLLLKNPSELFEIDIKDKYIAAAHDVGINAWHYIPKISEDDREFAKGEYWVKFNKEVINLKDPFKRFNSGLIIFDIQKNINDGINYKTFFDLISSKTNLLMFDEPIFNYVYKDKVHYLNFAWNVLAQLDTDNIELLWERYLPKDVQDDAMKARENPYLIHYVCSTQPFFMKDDTYNLDSYWQIARKSPYYETLLISWLSKKVNFINDRVSTNSIKFDN